MSIEPPYLGNAHGPIDKVRNRHGAEPVLLHQFKILCLNQNQAIVHDAVTFSFSLIRIWTAPIAPPK